MTMSGGFLVVKNTFICAVADEEPDSRVRRGRQRARTEGPRLKSAWPLLELEPLGEESWTESTSEGSEASAAGSARTTATESAAAGAGAGATADSADALAGVMDALEGLACGGARAHAVAALVCEAAGQLSFDASGARAVQLALERAGPAQAALVLAGLRGAIAAAARSRCASAVVEKAIYVSGWAAADCVATELLGNGRAMAFNSGGSGVVRALLEHAAGAPRVVELTDELLGEDLAALCCHKYGHRAVEAILSNGLARHRSYVVAALHSEFMRFGKHRFAAAVLQQALLQGPPLESLSLAQAVMAKNGAVAALACNRFGVDVVRALLQVPAASELALEYVRKSQRKLRKDLFGAELLRELGLGAPVSATACGGSQQGHPGPQALAAALWQTKFTAIPPSPLCLQGRVAIPQGPLCTQGPRAIVPVVACISVVAASSKSPRCPKDRSPCQMSAVGGA